MICFLPRGAELIRAFPDTFGSDFGVHKHG